MAVLFDLIGQKLKRKRNRKKVLEEIVRVIRSEDYGGFTIAISRKNDLRVYELNKGTLILKDYTKKHNAIRVWAIGMDEKYSRSLFIDLEGVIEPYMSEKEKREMYEKYERVASRILKKERPLEKYLEVSSEDDKITKSILQMADKALELGKEKSLRERKLNLMEYEEMERKLNKQYREFIKKYS